MKKIKIRFSFRSKTQLPLFMITKEWYDDNGEIEFAKVLFEIQGSKMRKIMKEPKNYCTRSINCAKCKRAKKGHWSNGLFFCYCKKGELLDPRNEKHYENCPYMRER